MTEKLIASLKTEIKKDDVVYNVVDFLNPKENDHTEILAGILNDKLILDSFLDMINNRYYTSFKSSPWTTIETQKGYIDCVIENDPKEDCKSKKFTIIIENKINYAKDQPGQIEDYVNKAKGKGFGKEEIFVIYLTYNGDKKVDEISLTDDAKEILDYKDDEEHGRFLPLNYKDDILPWLKNCVIADVLNKYKILEQTVTIYADYLDRICTETKDDEKLYQELCAKGAFESESKIHQYLQVCEAEKTLSESIKEDNETEDQEKIQAHKKLLKLEALLVKEIKNIVKAAIKNSESVQESVCLDGAKNMPFKTKELDNVLKEDGKGVNYNYQIEFTGDKLRCTLLLRVNSNFDSDPQKEAKEKIFKALKNKELKEPCGNFKVAWHSDAGTSKSFSEMKDDSELETEVKRLIEEALKRQDELLENIQG